MMISTTLIMNLGKASALTSGFQAGVQYDPAIAGKRLTNVKRDGS
jgi:hypothetical protein